MPVKRCFVVMGFGIKTDLATGRKLNLDKSYNALIKPVVESKGLVCVRADEIRHSGSIDLPMYQELLTADVVVADISTANANAFYELGLRHALRPKTTIVMSESEMTYPFDLNHILINKYTHLGDNIDYFEVLRFQKLLGETLDAVIASAVPDSPVYTFLDGLIPPSLQRQITEQVNASVSADSKPTAAGNPSQTMSLMVKQAEDAMTQKQYTLAKSLFSSALLMMKSTGNINPVAPDSYLVHRCAYATYKSKEPDELTAAKKAKEILSQLDLAHTNDSETVILAGKIEKNLYFNAQGDQHLADSILFFERGYFLLNNRYNAINLAFLFNLRVASSLYSDPQEKLADMVFASRIRRGVLIMCDKDLKKITEKAMPAFDTNFAENDALAATQKVMDEEQKFWIMVNKAEAHFGLGQIDAYKQALETARSIPHEGYMMKIFEGQMETLRTLLTKYGSLLSPPWQQG